MINPAIIKIYKNRILNIHPALLPTFGGKGMYGIYVHEAVLKACPIRLRPILMTSVATIAGAIPAAIGWGPGAETRAPMARGIIGGIVLSTLVTLVLVGLFLMRGRRAVLGGRLAAAGGVGLKLGPVELGAGFSMRSRNSATEYGVMLSAISIR